MLEFLQFCPAGFAEIRRWISSFSSKQCGLDPIPTWLLKKLSPSISSLSRTSIQSIDIFRPISFKETQVRPILKKSTLDLQLPSSYQSISNLSILSKLLELTSRTYPLPYSSQKQCNIPQDAVNISSASLHRNYRSKNRI